MAESIVLHFRSATRAEIFAFLRERCDESRASAEFFFPNAARYVLLMSEYSNSESESENQDSKKLEAILGGAPSFSLSIELRRSMQNIACDAAAKMVRALITAYELAVDDGSRLWKKAEIVAARSTEFLEIHRHHSYLPPRRILAAKLVAGSGLALLALRIALGLRVFWAGFGLLFIGLALFTTKKRCEHCGKHVTNFGSILPTYCRKCWTPYSVNPSQG